MYLKKDRRMLYRTFLLGFSILVLTACSGRSGVADTEKPVIALLGDATVILAVEEDYKDAGATATDNVDGNLTGKIHTVSNVNTDSAGTYQISYNVKDSAGNTADEVLRTVIVDGEKPIIALLGDTTAVLAVEEDYKDAGATASDDLDGNLTDNIVTTSTVDTSTAGIYHIAYNVKDRAGNAANEVVRTVIVGTLIKKTGQTKSYDENGTEIVDNTLKDDGFYQTGIVPNYTRDDAKNIVMDHITGLQWADDTYVSDEGMKKPWLTQENYDKCTGENGQTQDTSKCTDTSGDTAATYCLNLRLGGYEDWRLPNADELMNIPDRGKSNPSIDAIFQNTASDSYWISVTLGSDESKAWIVNFGYGDGYWYKKSNSYYVRCVRK